jgi:phosphotriesterase-related protein
VSRIRTVLGDIDPADLGVTLVHEHLLSDLRGLFDEPAEPALRELARGPLELGTVGWVRLNYTRNLENMLLDDRAEMAEEVRRYLDAGGRSIVELSGIGVGRDPEGLAWIARETGAHVVMGTGWYVEPLHPPDVASADEGALADRLIADVEIGVDGSGVRAGILGEFGCSWPVSDAERRVLRAAGRAQRATGAAITIHPGRHPDAPHEILEEVAAGGGDATRTVIDHVDRTIFDTEDLLRLARTGCYVEYDLFGNETSHYPFAPIDMPNDGTRVDAIIGLFAAGHGEQVLVSHDFAFRTCLRRYGGYGYAHMLDNVVPKMRSKGMSETDIRTLLVRNPARLLALG